MTAKRSRRRDGPSASFIHLRTIANVAMVSAVTPDLAITLTKVSAGSSDSREPAMKSGSMLSSTMRFFELLGWANADSSAAGPSADPPIPRMMMFLKACSRANAMTSFTGSCMHRKTCETELSLAMPGVHSFDRTLRRTLSRGNQRLRRFRCCRPRFPKHWCNQM